LNQETLPATGISDILSLRREAFSSWERVSLCQFHWHPVEVSIVPFPGIPYGFAPAWCFPFVEGSVFVLFLLCLLHAVRRDRSGMIYLLGGLGFGLLLEYFEVVTDSYTYGHFHIMLGRAPHDLPLWVGVAWGIIMYTARLFSDYLGLPLFSAAAMDTLLALNIDVSIDVVAYRLHMWHWIWHDIHLALTGQWFGIPYGNFVGWATVVFCYSIFSRIFARWMTRGVSPGIGKGIGKASLIAVLAVLSSLAALISTETLLFPILSRLGITSGIRLMVIVAALIATLAIGWSIGWSRRHESMGLLPPVALWVPAWFHLFFVGCFFGFGFYRENPWMTAAGAINFLLGIAIHLYPYRVQTREKTLRLANLEQEG
jgi:hypothetical protein